jgi:transcription elongation factor Elf1
MNKVIGTFKEKKYYCPICGSNKIRGESAQVGEDVCEMWLSCGNCDFTTSEENRVETVWGFEKDLIGSAYSGWKETIDNLTPPKPQE